MRQIDLREYERSEPVALAIDERDRLAAALRGSITIEPEPGAQDRGMFAMDRISADGTMGKAAAAGPAWSMASAAGPHG